MLTGRLPFESNDPMELVMLHRDSSPPPVTELRGDAPAVLESTTTAAMAKDPADRPADGTALLAALGAPTGLSSFTTTVSPPGDDTHATRVLPVAAAIPPAPDAFGAPIGPPPRRNRVPLLVIGLLVLLLAGAAVAYEVTRPASGSPSDTTPVTFAKPTTTNTQPTTTAPPTTTTTPSTQQTTTQQQTTTAQTTAPPTTTAPPPTTTTAPPVTTAPPAPTTTVVPTTTAPPTTTVPATTTGP